MTKPIVFTKECTYIEERQVDETCPLDPKIGMIAKFHQRLICGHSHSPVEECVVSGVVPGNTPGSRHSAQHGGSDPERWMKIDFADGAVVLGDHNVSALIVGTIEGAEVNQAGEVPQPRYGNAIGRMEEDLTYVATICCDDRVTKVIVI